MTAVTLRPVEPEDLPLFFAHQLDPEATRMAAFPARERDAFFAHWRTKILGNPNAVSRAIVCDGKVAGHIGAWTDPAHGERLIGYWLGRDFWGRGIASAAVNQFVPTEPTRPLTARVAKHNLASIRVLEKAGFVRTGEEQFPLHNGTLGEGWIYTLANET